MSEHILETHLGKPDVQGIYTKIAPIYDAWATLTETNARRACLERADIVDGQSVLEVAVGTGLMFADVLRRNPSGRNVGVDLTDAMLQRAKRRASRVAKGARFELVVGDAYALDFPDETFDRVINNYMFDLLPEQDFTRVLEQFHRVLKPGGRLALVNMTKGTRWFENAAEWVFRVRPQLIGGCRGVLLEPYVRAAGFEGIERSIVTQFGFPSEIVTAVKHR